MRYTILLSALAAGALAGCASANLPDVSDDPALPQTTRIVGTQGATEMRTNPSVARGVVMINASLADVWKALPAAYEHVGIPVTSSNPGLAVLGNDGFKLRRKLKDVPLTRYLDCGSTQGGPSAETYEIFLIIKTQLQPVEGGTRATTSLEASGRPVSISGNYVRCTSTGRLEERIGMVIGGQPPAQ